jgi:hypothetical protein
VQSDPTLLVERLPTGLTAKPLAWVPVTITQHELRPALITDLRCRGIDGLGLLPPQLSYSFQFIAGPGDTVAHGMCDNS